MITITKEVAESRLQYWKNKIPDMVSKYTPALPIPRYDKPFVFFHNRKVGGSSLRTIIAKEANRTGLAGKMWIPCKNEGCVPYSLPPSQGNITIFAGHINYMQMTQIIRETKARSILLGMTEPITLEKGQTVSYHKLDDSYPLFDCITNIRPTIDRVVSCWNYRMTVEMGTLRLPSSDSLTPEDWNNLLPVAMDKHNNGCNNEYARIFGSTAHESEVNSLSPSKPNFLQEFENIVSRMSRCAIVHINRCEDSNKILHHFVPWMSMADMCGTHEKNSNSTGGLSEEAAEVILELELHGRIVI
ncbi:hypothetical protein CTEN210_18524 [Chaetoceros tenuissimus]|uniref:Uncharacterized protein n=1 Tax=Chaetoceros tenuissimus TaxID=426638 RepID=A0AAD3DCV2_9STRA|nr:hypothetical protein CTEN210_18524 [Chaetoceros tenuissimus]